LGLKYSAEQKQANSLCEAPNSSGYLQLNSHPQSRFPEQSISWAFLLLTFFRSIALQVGFILNQSDIFFLELVLNRFGFLLMYRFISSFRVSFSFEMVLRQTLQSKLGFHQT
jgi:hypothetical protein